MSAGLVRTLDGDRFDILGDVHGEIGALRALLGRLGCDAERGTVERPLVFVGDLVDRGPDSVEVVQIVERLVANGNAQVVLGNHELNILFEDAKEGNGWFLGHADAWHHAAELVPFPSRLANERERQTLLAFLRSLPIALESATLRIVHAAWVPDAIERARHAASLEAFMAPLPLDLSDIELTGAPMSEELLDPTRPVPYHAGLAERLLREQNSQPIKVLTSGIERPISLGKQPQFLSGKWRFLERDPWWENDTDPRAVVFGHYWRRRLGAHDPGNKLDPFTGVAPTRWVGPRQQAFCVDYSVGLRFRARHLRTDPRRDFGLAALRWPERLLYYDDLDAPMATE